MIVAVTFCGVAEPLQRYIVLLVVAGEAGEIPKVVQIEGIDGACVRDCGQRFLRPWPQMPHSLEHIECVCVGDCGAVDSAGTVDVVEGK